jgi:hypothetical protein
VLFGATGGIEFGGRDEQQSRDPGERLDQRVGDVVVAVAYGNRQRAGAAGIADDGHDPLTQPSDGAAAEGAGGRDDGEQFVGHGHTVTDGLVDDNRVIRAVGWPRRRGPSPGRR